MLTFASLLLVRQLKINLGGNKLKASCGDEKFCGSTLAFLDGS